MKYLTKTEEHELDIIKYIGKKLPPEPKNKKIVFKKGDIVYLNSDKDKTKYIFEGVDKSIPSPSFAQNKNYYNLTRVSKGASLLCEEECLSVLITHAEPERYIKSS